MSDMCMEVEFLSEAVGGVKTRLPREQKLDAKRLLEFVKDQIEEHGILQLDGVFGTPEEVAVFMEELMEGYGSRDGMASWGTTATDPEQDGDLSTTMAVVPGHPFVRLLGNTIDEKTGKPTALLAKSGYQWHQDSYSSNGNTSNAHSMLYCCKAPKRGAQTLFASCARLWQNISDEQRAFVESHDAVYSNASTAGGPTAYDDAYGVRMNATGTRRIRAADRRRAKWKLNETIRKLCGRDERTGEMLFWPAAKNFERFVGMDAEASKDKLEELMLTALGNPTIIGELDDDLMTISETEFPASIVFTAQWQPGTK